MIALPYMAFTITVGVVAAPLLGHVAGRRDAQGLLKVRSCERPKGNLPKGCVRATYPDGSVVAGVFVAATGRTLVVLKDGQALVKARSTETLEFSGASSPTPPSAPQ